VAHVATAKIAKMINVMRILVKDTEKQKAIKIVRAPMSVEVYWIMFFYSSCAVLSFSGNIGLETLTKFCFVTKNIYQICYHLPAILPKEYETNDSESLKGSVEQLRISLSVVMKIEPFI
jgi:hypothetical protein